VALKIDVEDLGMIDLFFGRNARKKFIRDAISEKLARRAVSGEGYL
jgi:hypothetical protein